jgi:RNA polymerase sigma factor (sigma-70 family)
VNALPFCMQNYYDLFSRCKKGDAKAQRILYDLFKTRLMGLCRRYTRSREEAQDILQECFIRIFKYIHQLESSDKLESWMKTIAVNTAISYYHRTKKYEFLLSPEENHNVPDDNLLQHVQTFSDGFLVSLVNDLPDGCRMVFNMFSIEGYSHAEIAEKLKITEGTSRSQLHHAKYLLKEKLKCQDMAHYYEKFA